MAPNATPICIASVPRNARRTLTDLPHELDLVVKVVCADAGARVDEEDEVGLGAAPQPRHAGLEDGAKSVRPAGRCVESTAIIKF